MPSRSKIFSSDSTLERSSSTTSTVIASASVSGTGVGELSIMMPYWRTRPLCQVVRQYGMARLCETGGMKHVALLRGINVGGNNKLPMKDLAAIFVAAGCKDVVTYIQSGNVVFDASAGHGEEAAPRDRGRHREALRDSHADRDAYRRGARGHRARQPLPRGRCRARQGPPGLPRRRSQRRAARLRSIPRARRPTRSWCAAATSTSTCRGASRGPSSRTPTSTRSWAPRPRSGTGGPCSSW